MKQFIYDVENTEQLLSCLQHPDLLQTLGMAKSSLIQIYTTSPRRNTYEPFIDLLSARFPHIPIIGASTCGTIAEGHLRTSSIVITICCFECTELFMFALPCPDTQEAAVGQALHEAIDALQQPVAGVFLLLTPSAINSSRLLEAFSNAPMDYPVFGGGAGNETGTNDVLIFAGNTFYTQGVVAIVYAGEHLDILRRNSLGWRPLSRTMQITGVDGLNVTTINHKPAFDMYAHYLDMARDEHFFLNAIEFPLLIERNGEPIARIPARVNPDGSLLFLADLQPFESFRLAYGDPEEIMANVTATLHDMEIFEPDAIFMYNCCCRRYLFQQDAELETIPFASVAPVSGFYTYGELNSSSQNMQMLNASMIVIGMRETCCSLRSKEPPPQVSVPAPPKTSRVISKLVRFIGAVTQELEFSNQQLARLSTTDKLTQLYNRGKLDEELTTQIEYAERYQLPFSVILLDIDFFKNVNDTFGHMTGDLVLVQLALLLSTNIRKSDIAGRWGGEEFLLILPHTEAVQAMHLAEKIRKRIAHTEFSVAGFRTCSFGVTDYHRRDTIQTLMHRVDEALYQAKRSGRNCVILAADD
jgi:diguanylate cyclase (GGDEF)-like protein